MPPIVPDLDEFNKVEVLRAVWDTFAHLARQPISMDSRACYNLEGVGESLSSLAFDRCREAGLIPGNVQKWDYPPFKHIVLKVYYSALSMGLVLPGDLTQALNWNMQNGPFHFTEEGIRYFSEGFISIDEPGHLREALVELKQRLSAINDGQIELLLEAQRCVKAGCYRAGMVVIGVSSEDVCLGLLDAIPINCQAPATSSALYGDWSSCCNTTFSFSARWKPGARILKAIKRNLRTPGRGESWWQWWEMVPGSLFTVGEAVRVARNAAAHDSNREFTNAEVALLLSAMPIQLEMISNLSDFLNNPPSNLIPLQI